MTVWLSKAERIRGNDFDSGWDGVWLSEARITQTVGLRHRVPFSINFTKSRDVIWGLNFKPFIRRKVKKIFGPPTAELRSRVSEAETRRIPENERGGLVGSRVDHTQADRPKPRISSYRRT